MSAKKYDDPIVCPVCKDEDNTETYIYDNRQNCLNCGYEFNLPSEYYEQLRKDAEGQ